MTSKAIFINDYGRLRSGWRVLGFSIVFYAVLQILAAIVAAAYYLIASFVPTVRSHRFIENMIFRLLVLLTALIAGYLCNRWVEGLPFRALGLWPHRKWFRHFLVGSAVGFLSLALAAVIAFASGGLRFALTPTELMLPVLGALGSSAVLFIVAALAEEALFRGYPLQTLTRAHLAWVGVLITSMVFAAAHVNNPNAVLLGTLNTALAGVWLVIAYLQSRSLWYPLGVHWAWNWTLGSLFGLPVSGMSFGENTLLRTTDLGPAWLTGGNYGIEGGIACTIALIASTILIWRMPLVTPDAELLQLTSNENPRMAQETPQITPITQVRWAPNEESRSSTRPS